MILAILPDVSDAESLLNNLSEAEFDLDNVSLVTKDTVARDKVMQAAGPLKGVEPVKLPAALEAAGLPKDVIQRCDEAIRAGKVVVAMNVDAKYQPAALEMFRDMAAEIVQE